MRYYDFKKLIEESFGQQMEEQQDLFEVKMTYLNLQKLVKNIDAKAGFEFELIVPSIKVANIESLANEFGGMIGRDVNTSDSHSGGRREPGKYVVEPDSSLEANNRVIVGADGKQYKTYLNQSRQAEADKQFLNRWQGRMKKQDPDYVDQDYRVVEYNESETGLEFVSPPLPIDKMFDDLKKIRAWAKKNKITTNDSTGLHMNVSMPGYDERKLDFVKLALLIGDKYVLEQFGRSANTYCRSAIDKIKGKIAGSGVKTINSVLETMQKGLNSLASRLIQGPGVSKYTSINPQDNRVEFRSPGGDWLDEPIEKLSGTLLRFIVGLDAAIDPEKYKEEYYKKFYKLVTPAFEQDTQLQKVLSLYLTGDKEQARTQAQQLKIQKQAKRELVPGQKYEWEVMKIADQGRNSYYSVRVIATTEKEAISKGMAAGGIPFNNPDELIAIPKSVYKEPSTTDTTSGNWYAIQRLRAIGGNETVHRFKAQDRTEAEQTKSQYIADRRLDPRDYIVIRQQPPTSQSTTPPPELNGRPSNPDGNVYIASQENPEVPLYRFMAADNNDVGTVLNQWRNQYGSNYIYRVDHLQLQGQPRQTTRREPPQGQELIARLLGMSDQTADANYEIVRRDTNQPIFLFIANTPSDAYRVLDRYVNLIEPNADSEAFGFRERALPGSTLDLQRQRAEQSARAAVQNQTEPTFTAPEDNPDANWAIVDGNDFPVFYFTRNTRQEAEAVFRDWRNASAALTRNMFRLEPVQSSDSTTTSIRWRILVDGVEIHRFWNRSNQGEANTIARTWVQDQVRRGLLSIVQGAEVEVVPVQSN